MFVIGIDVNDLTASNVAVFNHSLNKLNFVTLDSIDVDYVPSIKNVRETADKDYYVNCGFFFGTNNRPRTSAYFPQIQYKVFS